MVAEYETYAARVGVFEMAPGESARKQLSINALKKIAKNYWYLIVVGLVIGVALLVALILSIRTIVRRTRNPRSYPS